LPASLILRRKCSKQSVGVDPIPPVKRQRKYRINVSNFARSTLFGKIYCSFLRKDNLIDWPLYPDSAKSSPVLSPVRAPNEIRYEERRKRLSVADLSANCRRQSRVRSLIIESNFFQRANRGSVEVDLPKELDLALLLLY
jgi:hypothetical protein